MSSQRGNLKKKAPRHQNAFAFQHNPKSKKTEKILSCPISGVCNRCFEQIAWRKKYRKYKPLTQPSACIYCHARAVVSAYHQACRPCARERNVCAKCCQVREINSSEVKHTGDQDGEIYLGHRERERRTFLRKLERSKKKDTEFKEESMEGVLSD